MLKTHIGDNERYAYLILKGSVFALVPKTRTYLDLNQLDNSDLTSDAGGSPARSEVRSLTFSPKRKNEGSLKPSFGQKEALTSVPQLYTLKDIPECEPFGGASLDALSPLRRNGITKNLTFAVSKTEKSYTKLASLNFSNAAQLTPEEVSSYHSDYRVASAFESGSFFGKPAFNPNVKR